MNSLNSADTERAFYINYINHTQINMPHNSILLLENTHLFETPPFPSFLILYAETYSCGASVLLEHSQSTFNYNLLQKSKYIYIYLIIIIVT